ncbi:SAP domain-containing ribonucleoprotein [Bicyclus anynana]|uniref:SAP domain-containing ribonucleoprotein n=1 Tax=Bicyclus anynana TaxID=110368 RepID=A0A6J1P7H2_BICAN|nr:SAP domain-containing ribonucleoprotein [Bicyclus anynana]
MADSTVINVIDVSKMKVPDIRKELRSRGLPYTGDKADIVSRLQAAMSQEEHEEHGDLDSDELDSDGVLEDDDKSQNDILDDAAVDTLNEELALEEGSPQKQPLDDKPQRTLKRKITTETKVPENKEAGTKKIVLNRTTSVTSNLVKSEAKKEITPPEADEIVKTSNNKIKITADIDPKTRLEMRAKRFGLPVKLTDEQRKEARKQRFNQRTTTGTNTLDNTNTGNVSDNLDKFKKRAERFGQSVSAIMTDIENKEKLEKRKAKFASLK